MSSFSTVQTSYSKDLYILIYLICPFAFCGWNFSPLVTDFIFETRAILAINSTVLMKKAYCPLDCPLDHLCIFNLIANVLAHTASKQCHSWGFSCCIDHLSLASVRLCCTLKRLHFYDKATLRNDNAKTRRKTWRGGARAKVCWGEFDGKFTRAVKVKQILTQ